MGWITYDQTYFLVTLLCYLATAALCWRAWFMKPFRLWTTLMHEFGHASAAWLCCHTVTGIEVNAEEGGLTHWQGTNVECAKHVVLPAGYLGSTLWGCLILLSANDALLAQVVASLLCVALAVCLGYACCGKTSEWEHRLTLIQLTLGFLVVFAGVLVMCFASIFPGCQLLLEALLLWVGVLNMMNATIDIYDDTVARSVDRSDAAQYAKIWPCCFPQCVGAIWLLLALAAFVGTFWASFLWAGQTGGDASWTAFLPGPIVLAGGLFLQCALPCCASAGAKEAKPLIGGKA